jgi:hypothetical protein
MFCSRLEELKWLRWKYCPKSQNRFEANPIKIPKGLSEEIEKTIWIFKGSRKPKSSVKTLTKLGGFTSRFNTYNKDTEIKTVQY